MVVASPPQSQHPMLQEQPVGQGEKVEQLWQRSVQSGGPVMYPALDRIVTFVVIKQGYNSYKSYFYSYQTFIVLPVTECHLHQHTLPLLPVPVILFVWTL